MNPLMDTENISHVISNVNHDTDINHDVKSFTPSIASRSSLSTTRSSSMTTDIGDEQIDQIREAFTVFDKEMTGSITVEQLSKVLDDLGYNIPENELSALIHQLDTNKSGTIEFEEYLSFMLAFVKKNFTAEENLREAFNLFDQNSDGFIEAKDLQEIMTNLGEQVTDEDIDEMIREADIDKDYKINFYEFQRIMDFR